MADTLTDRKLTQSQSDRITSPLELDMEAVFKVIRGDMIEMADGYQGTPDDFIDDIESLLADDKRGSVQKSNVNMTNVYGLGIRLMNRFKKRY